jgi:salicylate hydroxylase
MTIHRADLLAVIASGFPAERIHQGHRLIGLGDSGDTAEASCDSGVRYGRPFGRRRPHSLAARATLFGEEAPHFTGCVAYRGLVPAERIADLGLEIGSQSWVGPGAHLCITSCRGRLLNFVDWTEHDTWNREDWTDRATVARPLAAFEGWHPRGSGRSSRRRHLLHLGAVRLRAAAALVGRRHDLARRRLPPDAPLHGSGRSDGD